MRFYDWLVLASMAPGAAVGMARFRSLSPSMRYVALFLIGSLALELAADYRMIVLHKNNLAFYHFMTLLHYAFLSLAFRQMVLFPRAKRLMVASILAVIVLEIVFVGGDVQGLTQSPSWLRLVCRTLLLCWILFYLRTLLQSEEPQPLLSIPGFWVCLGILIHFASLLQVGIMHYLIETDRQLALSWYHVSIWFDVVFYLICTYALHLAASRSLTSDRPNHAKWDSL